MSAPQKNRNGISAVLLIALFLPLTALAKTELPSQKFRDEHVGIRKHLEEASVWAGDIEKKNGKDRDALKRKVVEFFKSHIVPHAEWEEKVLYPAVDKRAAKGPNPFTATMRYEHKIVGRWADELDSQEVSSAEGARKFVRKADRLIGLIDAHFQEEEEVLLPILDKTLSKEQFEKEIMRHSEKHK